MIAARLPTAASFAGLALCATAIALYFAKPDAPELIIAEPDRNFGTTPAASTHSSFFLMQNSTQHTIRVVGLAQC